MSSARRRPHARQLHIHGCDDGLTVFGRLCQSRSDGGVNFDGFMVTTGTEDKLYNPYYVLENLTYRGYDATLKVGPYYFGYLDNPVLENYVDHFACQDGLLIHYWNTSESDNNTDLHPGLGLLLPIDAHHETLYRVDGVRRRNRIQTYDSTFGLEPTDCIPKIHHNNVPSLVPFLPAEPVFDDRVLHYDPTNPLGSVIHPNTGMLIKVVSNNSLTGLMQVSVSPAKSK